LSLRLKNGQVADGDADRPLSIGTLLECQAIIPHYQRVNEIEEGCPHPFDSGLGRQYFQNLRFIIGIVADFVCHNFF
jgi:hypothetical protein